MPDEIKGFSQFLDNLKRLDALSRQGVMLKMANAAAELVRQRAADLAPVDSGALSKNIIKQKARGSAADETTVLVGPDKKVFYGFFQEFGTAHNAPQPFLNPALEQVEPEARQAMIDTFWANIPDDLKGKP